MPREQEGDNTARKAADSRTLTHKLTDVAQNVVITMHDCGTTRGITKGIMYKGDDLDRPLSDAIRGRVGRHTISLPTSEAALLEENELVTPDKAMELEKLGIDKIQVRSPMVCEAPRGVCRLCYGADLATGALVEEGVTVGIVAAQSFGESSKRLTTHMFHSGGLRRVMALFEARRPRNPMVMADVCGRVRLAPPPKRGSRTIEVIEEFEDGRPSGEIRAHRVPAGAILRVQQGEYVKHGDPLVHGTPDPHDILRILGETEVQEYLVREVQLVYRSQRVDIDDKHIEIIVARMLRKVKVYEPGDTGLLRGAVMDKFVFVEVNRRLTEECVKVVDPGDTTLIAGRVYGKEKIEGEIAALGAGQRKPTFMMPDCADCEVQLFGITEAAV